MLARLLPRKLFILVLPLYVLALNVAFVWCHILPAVLFTPPPPTFPNPLDVLMSS